MLSLYGAEQLRPVGSAALPLACIPNTDPIYVWVPLKRTKAEAEAMLKARDTTPSTGDLAVFLRLQLAKPQVGKNERDEQRDMLSSHSDTHTRGPPIVALRPVLPRAQAGLQHVSRHPVCLFPHAPSGSFLSETSCVTRAVLNGLASLGDAMRAGAGRQPWDRR